MDEGAGGTQARSRPYYTPLTSRANGSAPKSAVFRPVKRCTLLNAMHDFELSDPRKNFLRGSTLVLSSDLGGGMNKNVVASVPLVGSSLVNLSLWGFDKIEDVGFEKVLSKLPHLQSLNLR